MRRFAGFADTLAPDVVIKRGFRGVARHIHHFVLLYQSFWQHPYWRRSFWRRRPEGWLGVIVAMLAAVAGGLAGWLGLIELAILLVFSIHVAVAVLIAGREVRTEPPQHIETVDTMPVSCSLPPASSAFTPLDAHNDHRLLRLAARALEQGSPGEAALIYERAIRECPGDAAVQDFARHSLENLDLSRKIIENAQA